MTMTARRHPIIMWNNRTDTDMSVADRKTSPAAI